MMQLVTSINTNEKEDFPELRKSKPISFYSSSRKIRNDSLSTVSSERENASAESIIRSQSLKKKRVKKKKSSSDSCKETISKNDVYSDIFSDDGSSSAQSILTEQQRLQESSSSLVAHSTISNVSPKPVEVLRVTEDEGYFAEEEEDDDVNSVQFKNNYRNIPVKEDEIRNASDGHIFGSPDMPTLWNSINADTSCNIQCPVEEDDEGEGGENEDDECLQLAVSETKSNGCQETETVDEDDMEGTDLLHLISNSLDRFNAILHPNQLSNVTSGLGESEGVLSENELSTVNLVLTNPKLSSGASELDRLNLSWYSASCPVDANRVFPLAGDCGSPGPAFNTHVISTRCFDCESATAPATSTDAIVGTGAVGDLPVKSSTSSALVASSSFAPSAFQMYSMVEFQSDKTDLQSLPTSVCTTSDRASPLISMASPSMYWSNPTKSFFAQSEVLTKSSTTPTDMYPVDKVLNELDWLHLSSNAAGWPTDTTTSQSFVTRLGLGSSAPTERSMEIMPEQVDSAVYGATSLHGNNDTCRRSVLASCLTCNPTKPFKTKAPNFFGDNQPHQSRKGNSMSTSDSISLMVPATSSFDAVRSKGSSCLWTKRGMGSSQNDFRNSLFRRCNAEFPSVHQHRHLYNHHHQQRQLNKSDTQPNWIGSNSRGTTSNSISESTIRTLNQIDQLTTKPCVAKWRRACSFYLRGHCKKEDCEFAHDLTKVTCKFWEMGECFKGSTCPFLHGYPPEWTPE